VYTARGTYTFELHCFHCCEPMVMVHKCLHMTRRWWHFMPLALTLHVKCSIRRDVLCVFWKYGNKFVDMSAGTGVQLTVLRKHVLLCWQVCLDNVDNDGNDCELSMRRRKIDGLLRIQVSRLLAAWRLMHYSPQNTMNCSSTNTASHDSRQQTADLSNCCRNLNFWRVNFCFQQSN